MKMKKKAVRTIGAGLFAVALLLPTSAAFASGHGHGGDTNTDIEYTDNSVFQNGLLNIGGILSGNILSNNQINLLNGNGIGLLGFGAANKSGNTQQNQYN